MERVRHATQDHHPGVFTDRVLQQLKCIRQSTTPPRDNPNIKTLEPQAIVEIARWLGFEENALWYFKVGRILCSGMHFNKAIQYLDIALTRNPKVFWAWATLANCHAMKKDLHNGISCQLHGIQAFHADSEHR